VVPSRGTTNWVSFGIDHRLCDIWSTWRNGAPLDERQMSGLASTMRKRDNDHIAKMILARGGDDSDTDELGQLLYSLGVHESAAVVAQMARAVLNHTASFSAGTITEEHLVLGLFDPRHRDDIARSLLHFAQRDALDAFVSTSDAGPRRFRDIDPTIPGPPHELDFRARTYLEAAAKLPSGLRSATLLAYAIYQPEGGIGHLLQDLTGTPLIELAAKILTYAPSLKAPGSQLSFFAESLDAFGLSSAVEDARKEIEVILPSLGRVNTK
jgi:hypothetical protein